MVHELGEDAAQWSQQAKQVQAAVREKFYSRDGIYDLSGLDETAIKVRSAASFTLLFGGCVDQDEAAKLVETLRGPEFWTAYPVPTTPADDPAFDPGHYWRGNVWPSVNWLIYEGLRRYGFEADASFLVERNARLVERGGFHEYFNPITGKGYGPDQQSWATVILDMLARERSP
jgi:glycogen debranching enzyme